MEAVNLLQARIQQEVAVGAGVSKERLV